MAEHKYIFKDTQSVPELDRLKYLEAACDPATRRRLASVGLARGWHCLEVGAGAGSVARWLSEQVGPDGRVVALDMNTRFLSGSAAANLEVIEGDIRTASLPPDAFDVVHARYVLIHVTEAEAALASMLACLKPGGWLVLEEPDFSFARCLVCPNDQMRQSFDSVYQAIEALYSDNGLDHAYGAGIPGILQVRGCQGIDMENDASIERGGSPVAQMMTMSTKQLRDKYIATGRTAPADVDRFCAFTADPGTWAIYYATIRGSARKPLP